MLQETSEAWLCRTRIQEHVGFRNKCDSARFEHTEGARSIEQYAQRADDTQRFESRPRTAKPGLRVPTARGHETAADAPTVATGAGPASGRGVTQVLHREPCDGGCSVAIGRGLHPLVAALSAHPPTTHAPTPRRPWQPP